VAPYSEYELCYLWQKAQLLNILNLKSSSPERRNFHGYKVPFEYTMEMTVVLYMLGKALAARHYTH
jgi:hypothetical protein